MEFAVHGLGGLWEVGFFVGVLVLGAALAWGMLSSRRRNPANDPVREAATRSNYENTDTYEDKEVELRNKTRS